MKASAPTDFDRPLPAAEPTVKYVWREVPKVYLDGLRAEESPATVSHHAVRLAHELLVAANGPASMLSNAELVPLVTEVRDYCIADGAAGALLELVKSIRAQHGIGIELVTALVDAIGAPEAIGHLLDCLHPGLSAAPPELTALLLELSGNHVGVIVEHLNATEDPQVQLVLKDLMSKLAAKDASSLMEQLHHADRKVRQPDRLGVDGHRAGAGARHRHPAGAEHRARLAPRGPGDPAARAAHRRASRTCW